MEKIISYPLSAIYYLLFGTTLAFFHVVQWICFNLFGYKAHKKSVDVLSFFLVANTGNKIQSERIGEAPNRHSSDNCLEPSELVRYYLHLLVYAQSASQVYQQNRTG